MLLRFQEPPRILPFPPPLRCHLGLGLKTKILNKCLQASTSSCSCSKRNKNVATFCINCSSLVNIVGSPYKHRDAFRKKQEEQIKKALESGVLEMG